MRKINFLVIILLLFSQVQCFAVEDTHGTLNPQQLVLGGISLRNTRAYFEQIYGKPDYSSSSNGYNRVYHYGNSLQIIYFDTGSNSEIYEIKVNANNGFATVDGVIVGMPEKVLQDVYGEPTSLKTVSSNKKIYIYYGINEACLQYFKFTIRDGIIKEIILHWAD